MGKLFAAETIITQRVATRVFAGLKKEGELDPKKRASQLGIVRASCVSPPLPSSSRRGRNTDDGTSFKLTAKGITVKYKGNADDNPTVNVCSSASSYCRYNG